MKRNMDLVRLILLKLSEYGSGSAPSNFSVDGYSEEEVGYHCVIMEEAGLIEAVDVTSMYSHSPKAIPTRLTWEGHEFIENAQNEKVWGQAKEAVEKLGGVSFSVWVNVLTQVAMRNLGMGS